MCSGIAAWLRSAPTAAVTTKLGANDASTTASGGAAMAPIIQGPAPTSTTPADTFHASATLLRGQSVHIRTRAGRCFEMQARDGDSHLTYRLQSSGLHSRSSVTADAPMTIPHAVSGLFGVACAGSSQPTSDAPRPATTVSPPVAAALRLADGLVQMRANAIDRQSTLTPHGAESCRVCVSGDFQAWLLRRPFKICFDDTIPPPSGSSAGGAAR